MVFTASITNELQALNVNVMQQYTKLSLCTIRFAMNIEINFFPYTTLISSPQQGKYSHALHFCWKLQQNKNFKTSLK